MSSASSRAVLKLTEADRRRLERLADSRTAARREVDRAQILLYYASGMTITEIHRRLRVSRPTIYKCIDKALAAGAEAGLKDHYHRPREPVIGEPEKAWVINLACQKPTALGLAAELWSLSALARYPPVSAYLSPPYRDDESYRRRHWQRDRDTPRPSANKRLRRFTPGGGALSRKWRQS